MDLNIAAVIDEAFGWREKPISMTSSEETASDIYEDAVAFSSFQWSEVTVELLREHPACIFGFSGPAFAYYLPGILRASFESKQSDLVVVDALLGMLDTSGVPDLWSPLLVEQWSELRPTEFQAVRLWMDWLNGFDPGVFHFDNQFKRVVSTLDALQSASAKE